MTRFNGNKCRFAAIAAVAGALAISAPVASAQGSDPVERALHARLASEVDALEARERAMTERPGHTTTTLSAQTAAMLDARERSQAASRPVGSVQQPTSSRGFDWSDFGIGAGAGVGFMLLLGGIGALALRRSEGRVTTA